MAEVVVEGKIGDELLWKYRKKEGKKEGSLSLSVKEVKEKGTLRWKGRVSVRSKERGFGKRNRKLKDSKHRFGKENTTREVGNVSLGRVRKGVGCRNVSAFSGCL